jgi:non-ribosomal peptide synthetase component E (peptide arylation enzyme)
VLGLKEGLALIDRLDDVEAIIIDNQGVMHMSKGMENLQQATKSGKP